MRTTDILGFGKNTDSSRGPAAMKTRSYPYFSQRLVAFATVDQPVTDHTGAPGCSTGLQSLAQKTVTEPDFGRFLFPERFQNIFSHVWRICRV